MLSREASYTGSSDIKFYLEHQTVAWRSYSCSACTRHVLRQRPGCHFFSSWVYQIWHKDNWSSYPCRPIVHQDYNWWNLCWCLYQSWHLSFDLRQCIDPLWIYRHFADCLESNIIYFSAFPIALAIWDYWLMCIWVHWEIQNPVCKMTLPQLALILLWLDICEELYQEWNLFYYLHFQLIQDPRIRFQPHKIAQRVSWSLIFCTWQNPIIYHQLDFKSHW